MLKHFLRNFGVTKKYKVKITLSAQSDIRTIWDYVSQLNPSNALVFINEIEERIYALSPYPERSPIIPEGEMLQNDVYRHLIYKDYRIVYRVQNENIFILRIFNGSKLLDMASLE
jgi:toxin ParE1/3/4